MHRLQLLFLSVATTALAVGATAGAAPRAPAKSRPAAAGAAAPGSVFAEPSPLFLHAPQWDKIKDSDFQPGLEAGMARQKAEIAAIADNPAPPTFENTIVAMERSGQMLDRANSAFSALTGANTNDTLQKIETEESPRLTAHRDAIYLNPKLFQRVKAIYDRRADLKLDPEARQLLEVTYQQFVHAGANLPEADKTRLKALNGQIASLETAFQQKLLAGAKAGALVIDDKAKLQGLSDAQIAAAAAAAETRGLKGKWVIVLQNTTQQPLLQDLADRGVREQLYNSAWTRTERGDANDTRETLATIARLRAEKAKLLGFPSFAAYVLEDQMAKTPQAAEAFMHQLSPAARARSMAEAADIQKVIDQGGEHFQVKPWDWNRYSER
ncbi:MAG: dipeptidyl carboxypeptidase, partial [Phenylobacterium sp.]|nr:dipeptidyl carboxypeptidase [Phenylobacterium sp.]